MNNRNLNECIIKNCSNIFWHDIDEEYIDELNKFCIKENKKDNQEEYMDDVYRALGILVNRKALIKKSHNSKNKKTFEHIGYDY